MFFSFDVLTFVLWFLKRNLFCKIRIDLFLKTEEYHIKNKTTMRIRITNFLLAAMIAWLAGACTSQNGSESANSVETKFKNVNIQTKDGKHLLFSDYLKGFDSGKPVVVITWFDDCPGCRKVIEKLIAEKEKDQAFELVVLNIDKVGKKGSVSTQKEYEQLKKSAQWNCESIFDPTGSYAREYLEDDPSSTETFIILDGIVRYSSKNSEYISYRDQDVLVTAALASQKAPVQKVHYYDTGEENVSYGFDNFNRTGTWTAHHKNGKLKYVIPFVEGKKEGLQKYYSDNGQLDFIGNFKAGKEEGEWKYYYDNGQLKFMGSYEDGKTTGEWKAYFDNGKLSVIGHWKNDEKDGPWKSYFKNGQLRKSGNYSAGKKEGDWKYYHSNGKTEKAGSYVQGKKTGLWKDYYMQGQIKMVGLYVDGKPDGEWKIYHDNGQLYQVRLWEKGKFMDVVSCFDGKGKALDKGTLVNGNGTVISYYKSGKFKSINNYIDGKKQKGYADDLRLKKINQLAKKTKRTPLKPYTRTSSIRFRTYPLSRAVRMDSIYYIIIPLDVPKDKTVLLLMKNVDTWRIFTGTDYNTARSFRKYNLKKQHVAYVNGKKLHLSRLSNLISQGGGSDLDMTSMKGQNCYLSIEIKEKKYKKIRKEEWPYYVGYYAFNDEQGLKKFRQKLHSLE